MFLRNRIRNPHIPLVVAAYLAGLIIGYAQAKKFQRDEQGMQDIAHYGIFIIFARQLNGNAQQQINAGVGMVSGLVAGCIMAFNDFGRHTDTPIRKFR